jgi:putative endonuclease
METTVMIGGAAEDVASRLLLRQGYFVVERNFRCKAGELDVVAYRADPQHGNSSDPKLRRAARMLVFIEVRSRTDDAHGDALLAINPAKQRQVVRIAGWYLSLREPDYDEIRFDVVGITEGVPTLVEDAFRPQ